LPFVKTSGTSNKPYFIDDTTSPLSYNPSTNQLGVNAIRSNTSTDLTLNGAGGSVNLQSNGTTKAFVDGGGLQIPTGSGQNATLSTNWFSTGSVINTNLYSGALVNRILTLGALDTSTAITKFPYGSINKYITTAERLYCSATDTSPITLSGTDTAKTITTATTTASVRPSISLSASNTGVGSNGSCNLLLQSGTNNLANAPKLSCSNYNSVNYNYADLVVDSGISGGNLIGCKLETTQTAEYNQTWGYSNGGQKSSVYYTEDSGGEFRMDITASGISFKGGSVGSPLERMLITANQITINGVDLSISAGNGIKNNFFNLTASTTGDYILSSANAYRTTINIPTAPRTFRLPDPPSSWTGVWFGICNRSNTNSISINLQSGQQVASLQTALSSAGGGSYAQFTSDGTAWFRSG
jgi:hypothetical protein